MAFTSLASLDFLRAAPFFVVLPFLAAESHAAEQRRSWTCASSRSPAATASRTRFSSVLSWDRVARFLRARFLFCRSRFCA